MSQRPPTLYHWPRVPQTAIPRAQRSIRQFSKLGMPLSRAFYKLMEGGLLTQLLGLYPSLCHLSSRWTFTVLIIKGSSIPFTLRPDDDDLEERDVQIVNHSGRVDQPPPLVARPFDGTVSHEEVRRKDDKILRQLLSHKVPFVLLDNGSALNVCPLATAIALGYAPSDFGPSTQTTLEVGDFCRDLVVMSFNQHSNTMVLNMMRGMSFMPGLGYMAHLHRERVRARLTCTPFYYPVRLYRMSLVDYFVRGSETHPHMLRDETSGTPVLVMIVHSLPDQANFLSLCFLEETTDCGVDVEPTGIAEMVQPESASPFDLFGVSAIEVDEEIQTVLTLELMENVTVGDDEFEDTFGFIKEHDEIAQPDSSRDSSDHDSDPINERVSPVTRDVETIDFGTENQSRKLKIGSPLSTDERDRLIHLLKSYLDVFAWSYEDMQDGKVRVCVDFRDLNKASHKDDFPFPHIDLLVDSTTGHSMLSFMDGFFGYNQILMALEDMKKTTFITEWGTYCYRVMPFGLKNAGSGSPSGSREILLEDLEIQVEAKPQEMHFGVTSGKLLGHMVSERGLRLTQIRSEPYWTCLCRRLRKRSGFSEQIIVHQSFHSQIDRHMRAHISSFEEEPTNGLE
ncbi:Transposon Ty3-I Gag-Pol polyprotein [Vitis vinifera]|uniref:Transposon Ty3-I Gag-Pol polyprotein n=1 Tax=Vitis vinifera TaxID=29760 RepID=A0A438H220_VITVI|nr:Transposon Ty3-I Gag-Pol polyprotein [Vitis vinifera]